MIVIAELLIGYFAKKKPPALSAGGWFSSRFLIFRQKRGFQQPAVSPLNQKWR